MFLRHRYDNRLPALCQVHNPQKVKEILFSDTAPKGDLERHVFYSYDLYQNGLGQDNPDVVNTAYAVVQGVSDYLDHQIPLRKGNTREQRFEKGMFGLNANIKQKAWDMALAWTN